MATRVLIAAAYASVRAGLAALLEARGCAVLGQASSPAELVALLAERPDVVLLDLPESPEGAPISESSDDLEADEPGVGDLGRALDALARAQCAAVLIGDSASDFEALLARPLRGWAWLARDAEGAEIASAVHAAAGGLAALDRSRLSLLLASHAQDAAQARLEAQAPEGPEGQGVRLTSREREVLRLLADGLPNKSIARRLGVSPHTAKFHVASILSKLGAASRTEAVAIGARSGYLML